MADTRPNYDQIGPHHAFLSDEAVLVQAWKKSHDFIRRHNWYADTLELDLSTLNLQEYVQNWQNDLSLPRAKKYSTNKMRLVPAPKGARWTTPTHKDVAWNASKWHPQVPETKLKLRPLAHLSLRDQVAATAAMICLANCVETAQGNPAPSYADDAPIASSFGNRLFCHWKSSTAVFGWGNAKTYRQYYTDYRRFLDEPVLAANQLKTSETVAIVQLDLSGFYDRVDRTHLLKILRQTASAFHTADQQSEEFWDIIAKIFNWHWHESDRSLLPKGLIRKSNIGLPQGLVASGFFANAYMLPFDLCMRQAIGDMSHELDWTIHKYFRYVDDIRLVVSFKTPLHAQLLSAQVSDWVNQQLTKTAPNQQINSKKTAVTFVAAGSSGMRVSPAMEAIQHQASGPVDVEACKNILRELDGLFPLAEQAALDRAAREESAETPSAYQASHPGIQVDPIQDVEAQLLDIFLTDVDVKPESIERFAANRWRRAFRTLRQFNDGAHIPNERPAPLQALDERANLFAKRLIRRWIQDPSLVSLLRVAMDVCPRSDNLALILNLIEPKMSGKSNSARVCCYIASELFRAGATETGYTRHPEELPHTSDVGAYRQLLAAFAQRCLDNDAVFPWYLNQQALLYLATQQSTITASSVRDDDLPLLENYLLLHQVLAGTLTRKQLRSVPVAFYLLAHHIAQKADKLAPDIAKQLETLDPSSAASFFDRVLDQDRPLAEQVHQEMSKSTVRSDWQKLSRGIRQLDSKTSPVELEPGRSCTLEEFFGSGIATFSQENAALVLLDRLCDLFKRHRIESIRPEQVTITSKNWNLLCDPRFADVPEQLQLELTQSRKRATKDAYSLSDQTAGSDRFRLIVGRILRAAIVGDQDYTLHKHDVRTIIRPYQGLRTSWYKRQYGMSNSPSSLVGPAAPMSPWLGELLAALLRWPGMAIQERYIKDWSDVQTPNGLSELVRARLRHQLALYGTASEIPMYYMDVYANQSASKIMTLVMAQTVLPLEDDFKSSDIGLDNLSYRSRHSRHLAAVAKLVEHTLEARDSFSKRTKADLIVFPELSVHEKDINILERLVDRTGAIVFCGLVFRKTSARSGFVNEGLWLIPDYSPSGRSILRYTQGKHHMTRGEEDLHIQPCRTHQRIIRGVDREGRTLWRITGAICFDATDLKLAADLRDKADAFIVPALNKDIPTFDHMVEALHFHMYQHFILVNSGEYGGSTAQAPYREHHEKQIIHCHGINQAAISVCEIDLSHFLVPDHSTHSREVRKFKSPPAGLRRLVF